MERRRFLSYLCTMPLISYATVILSGCSDEQGAIAAQNALKGQDVPANAYQGFGYYQGLGETERRDPGRTDGTTYNMPCITADEIAAGVEKSYEFWHGHGGQQHHFTITADDFVKLQAGTDIEIFTSIVESHRHALLISPRRRCESNAC